MNPIHPWVLGLGPKPDHLVEVPARPVFEKVYPVHRYATEIIQRKGCQWCPECGSSQFVNKNLVGHGFRECRKCGQEWWTDITYDKQHAQID